MTDVYASQDDLWEVQTADGQLHTLTLDQLDAAFEADMVSADTLVRPRGATSWQPLSVMAGLDEAEATPGPATTSLAPMVVANGSPSFAPPPPAAALRTGLDLDLDLDLDAHALRPNRGKAILGVIGGVAALAFVVALGVTKLGPAQKAAASGAAANAIGLPAAATAAEPVEVKSPASRLTEEQKQALIEADKAREAARKAKAPPPGRAKAVRRKSTGGSPFVQGGNKYDPLNGAL